MNFFLNSKLSKSNFCPSFNFLASCLVKGNAGMSSSAASIGNILSKTVGLCIISLEKSIKIVSLITKFPTDNLLSSIT